MLDNLSPLLALMPSQVMFALGVAILTAILLRRSYRLLGKRRKGGSNKVIETQPRPETAWSGSHQDAHARMNRQEVELHNMGRDFSAQLDSKMIVLQELIAQSQKQIDQLERLLKESENQINEKQS